MSVAAVTVSNPRGAPCRWRGRSRASTTLDRLLAGRPRRFGEGLPGRLGECAKHAAGASFAGGSVRVTVTVMLPRDADRQYAARSTQTALLLEELPWRRSRRIVLLGSLAAIAAGCACVGAYAAFRATLDTAATRTGRERRAERQRPDGHVHDTDWRRPRTRRRADQGAQPTDPGVERPPVRDDQAARSRRTSR
jgi:hypothetical protein